MSPSDFFESMQDVDVTDFSSWPYGLKLIGTFMIGGIILFVVYTLFYAPKHDSLETAMREETSLKQIFKQKQTLAINLPAYQAQMLEIKGRFENVLLQLPNKTEIPSLLTDISQAGTEQGMVFKRFKPAESEELGFFVRLPIQIQTSGSYHQLASFISAIANFKRIVTIGDFEIKRASLQAQPSKATPFLDLTADIYTYHFSETETLSAGQATLDAAMWVKN